MKFDFKKLRGRMIEKHGTIKKFSNSYSKSYIALSNKLNHQAKFNTDDIVEITKLLEIPIEEIGEYFFKEKEDK